MVQVNAEVTERAVTEFTAMLQAAFTAANAHAASQASLGATARPLLATSGPKLTGGASTAVLLSSRLSALCSLVLANSARWFNSQVWPSASRQT